MDNKYFAHGFSIFDYLSTNPVCFNKIKGAPREDCKKYVEKDILDCYGITTSQKKEMLKRCWMD
jgi:hypothetical protein